ncbi:MAG TPA: transferrin receptor-like dimerization domain-containing protein, partial [Terriglobia bacterium]|nr:transferrin receptor-like dimerization domain-containing protein [Terriglobia bacterium]
PMPKKRLVEMVAPARFRAKLEEPTVAVDPTSSQHNEQLPTYNMYSGDGDVTAPLVYVNYGMRADYDELQRLGISVKGALVIARYGNGWRGLKPKLAAQHGAVGCLIYSDPKDDGYWRGDVFPEGPWRPREGVQRGSVMDMLQYPGDPLTPDIGATKGAKRLSLSEAKSLMTIPVLPLSYGDAQPLLAALHGPVAPPAWRGALPITYHVGPGPAKVHLAVKSTWNVKPIWDVIAKIQGSLYPDEWIIRGNHQDAWVNGAQDPLSGFSAELGEARAIGELVKEGWKPKRTIIYCAWDGEEEGLLGSTEWAEEHATELRRHAAMYINSDSNDRGYLLAEGSHSLQKFIDEVGGDIEDPEKGIPVEKRLRLYLISRTPSEEYRAELRHGRDIRIGALGSGSDYSAFIDHLGIASLDLGFGGESGGGIYHSIYDDFYWYTHFGDTNFAYGKALAQTAGTAVMRFADADLLPYDFTDLSSTVIRYVAQLRRDFAHEQEAVQEQNERVQDGVFTATKDPEERLVFPHVEPVPPYLDFAPLENGSAHLAACAREYERALARAEASGGAVLDRTSLQKVNETLVQSERMLTTSQGLPGRPWYQHVLYAPGLFTGYAANAIPGVRQEIDLKHWQLADDQLQVAGEALDHEADLVHRAAAELEQAIH